jgi:hypothetical protein
MSLEYPQYEEESEEPVILLSKPEVRGGNSPLDYIDHDYQGYPSGAADVDDDDEDEDA